MGGTVIKSRKKFYNLEVRVEDTSYLATEDGFFIGIIYISVGAGAGIIQGRTDENNPPLLALGFATVELINDIYVMNDYFCIPVKKGDYYKALYTLVFGTPTIERWYYWRPLK